MRKRLTHPRTQPSSAVRFGRFGDAAIMPGHPCRRAKTTQSMTTVGLAQNNHAGADPDAVVEVHDVLVGHPNAAGRDRLADRLRFI